MKSINVFSEIGQLKKVLVHRPGDEVENLTPDLLERLLFDDIPFKKLAVKEHDEFTRILRENGVEVVYIEELVAETLDKNPDKKDDFINRFIQESKVCQNHIPTLKQYLLSFNNLDMVKKMIAGIKKIEVNIKCDDKYPFICDPLPNVLFQRDPFASVGNGVTVHKMWSVTRNRETLFPDFVFENHPEYQNDVVRLYTRQDENPIEGGDILVLNKEILIIGVTQRTNLDAIRTLAKRLWVNSSYRKIIALDLPKSRAFMHLDTVFTNIDYDKFIVHPLIFDVIDEFKIIEITPDAETVINKSLLEVLEECTKRKVQLIKCGGEDPIAAGREQWNDGTNVLTISPGKVIAYNRNWVTIDLLKKAGVEVLEMPSSELSRGRGGPRCMSMPLYREDLK